MEQECKTLKNQCSTLAEDRKTISSCAPPAGDLRRRRPAVAVAENPDGIVLRIIYVSRRNGDADRAVQKLNQLETKVDLYKTDDSGNAFFTGELFVKSGYENYSPLITKTVQEREYLTADSASQKYFNDSQQLNLWIAKQGYRSFRRRTVGKSAALPDVRQYSPVFILFRHDTSAKIWRGHVPDGKRQFLSRPPLLRLKS